MDIVFKSEVLHCSENLANRIANLCSGRYLPVEVPGINAYSKGECGVTFGEKHPHYNFLVVEPDHGIVEPEVLCCVDKLRQTWNGKPELLEEYNLQKFETRGRDPTNQRFQVSANASEPEQAEVRKCNVCRDWRMCEWPLHITVRYRECKLEIESL